MGGDGQLSTAQAGMILGVTAQTVRQWLESGVLVGTRSGTRGSWRVDPVSVDAWLDEHAERRRLQHDSSAVDLARLADLVDALVAEQKQRDELADALRRERDHYRSEAAAVRAAALSLNAAAADVRAAISAVLGVLDQQSDALTQLLAPGHPADLA